MANGYTGKILHVDLSAREIRVEEPSDSFYRKYLGGPGIGYYYLLREMTPGTDPLSPSNVLTFAAGTLAGTLGPAVCRFTVCAKSPLTGAAGKSEAGGFWGPELKMAGWDAVVIRGQSDAPAYLWINGPKVEIRDASHLWGKDTIEVEADIRREVGEPKARVAQIGPAGERMVRFANITNELAHFNGRNGLGAVMGSKRLRAIAVKGTGPLPVHDGKTISDTGRWVAANMKNHSLAWGLHDGGTPAGIVGVNASGSLPTNNWGLGTFPQAEAIGGGALNSTILVNRKGCFACPIRCKRVVKVEGADLVVDPAYGGPEYETLVALGSNCGIGNLELLAKANERCNALGMDTISAGMTISFAMKCFEEGILSPEDTDGMELRFGNETVLLPLLESISRRQGIGELMAQGSRKMAGSLGRGSEEFLIEVRGQEVPMHDPRVKTGVGMQYALSGCGADHWVAQHDPLFAQAGSPSLKGLAPAGVLEPVSATDLGPAKVRAFYQTQMLTSAYDLLGACVFGVVARSILPLDRLVGLVSAATGWDVSLWEIMKAGERATNMARLFNAREGLARAGDRLPSLFFRPFADGPLAGKGAMDPDQFSDALELYYGMAGWDTADGSPSRAKLVELSLEWTSELEGGKN